MKRPASCDNEKTRSFWNTFKKIQQTICFLVKSDNSDSDVTYTDIENHKVKQFYQSEK